MQKSIVNNKNEKLIFDQYRDYAYASLGYNLGISYDTTGILKQISNELRKKFFPRV